MVKAWNTSILTLLNQLHPCRYCAKNVCNSYANSAQGDFPGNQFPVLLLLRCPKNCCAKVLEPNNLQEFPAFCAQNWAPGQTARLILHATATTTACRSTHWAFRVHCPLRRITPGRC